MSAQTIDRVTDSYYFQHYFDLAGAGRFLTAAFLGLVAVIAIMLAAAALSRRKTERMIREDFGEVMNREETGRRRAQSRFLTDEERFELERQQEEAEDARMEIRRRRRREQRKGNRIIESFYELVFASTSVLLFLSLYNIVDWHMPQVWAVWNAYQALILVLFLVFSVIFTNIFDRYLVQLPHLADEDRASVRLVSTIYICLILMYIRFIYKDTNYDQMIIYFASLAIGRFVYFDFTWKDFIRTVSGVAKNLPLLALLLLYSGFICWYGFHVGFLLTSNGVVVSILIAHLFMDLSIVILRATHLIERFL